MSDVSYTPVDLDPLDLLPSALIQYGVQLMSPEELVDVSMRWRHCWDAVKFGQACVDDDEDRALAFRVFRESSV